jgi:hypothetical protein
MPEELGNPEGLCEYYEKRYPTYGEFNDPSYDTQKTVPTTGMTMNDSARDTYDKNIVYRVLKQYRRRKRDPHGRSKSDEQ